MSGHTEKSLSEIRDNFAETVEHAQLGIATIGYNRGKRAVAIVPVEVFDAYVQYETAELRGLIAGAADGTPEDTTPVLSELDALVNRVEKNTP